MSILKIENIVKTYGKGSGLMKALNGVDLAIEKGSFTTIIGRSGSGKSTLLNIAGGLTAPDSGRVLLEETDLYSLKDRELSKLRRKKIGIVFQAFNLIPEFTVLENICLPSYLDQSKPNMKFIDEILDFIELSGMKDKYPYELSGGEQQRTALARALSTKPEVLLADEPTGNLDLKSGEQVLDAIRYCYRIFNQTTLLVTHNLEIAQQSKRVITLQDGSIVCDSAGEMI
ncbi:ABC transporter ATP-binding protein [Anaerocolumna sp. AGMB13025]|uniref:ABC transporter ATP-binding protein n=1 Tax=Anaerocolumna sp. AGMB13025 TaxID=3039116 RepID=UPI00241D63C9|nr:ABC transporter ATP-binding protein [Anaerocolumna sp. AGMB13025]WFR57727.1 ABC transporter ATP-binding protein [Anaerocolumna sp. AGMB13025]